MVVITGWSPVAVVVFLVATTGRAQDPTDAPPPPPPPPAPPAGGNAEGDDDAANGFIVPNTMDDDVDVFGYGPLEFLVVNRKRRYKTASFLCRLEFGAKLGIIADGNVAMFLAEALSETNLVMDALWTAGQTESGNDSDWRWVNGNETVPIDPDLVRNFSKVVDVEASDRKCLAFARLNHDLPDYRALACNAQRAVLCQRPRGGGGGNSTHPGWIKLGKRLFKIFSEMVSYDKAAIKCFQHDVEAQLAVIVNYNYSQLLGRYLLISRPSLENAWIGARWNDGQYRFEPEEIELKNTSEPTDLGYYPPWRNHKIQKVGGCVLLDRHLANYTLFVEARCERSRPYICYKSIYNDTGNDSFTDIIINDNGYRLHFGKRTWEDARDYCSKEYHAYGAWLAEIPSSDVKYELLYVMGENRTAIVHIWLGGSYDDKGKGWTWAKDGSAINLSVLDWVTNTTFNNEAEEGNTCLDMDRENHIRALHYGADCKALQHFVCAFTKAKLLELEEYERKLSIDRSED